MKFTELFRKKPPVLPAAPPPEPVRALNAAIPLVIISVLLFAFGSMMLYSASSGSGASAKFFANQMLWGGVGVIIGTAAVLIGYRFFCRHSLIWVAVCLLLLIWARFCREINGAHRWIILGPLRLQPSELAKIAVSLFVAEYCSEHTLTFSRWKGPFRNGIFPLGIVVGSVCLLIFIGKDLGTTLLVALTAFLTMLAGGLPLWYLLLLLPVGGGLVLVLKYFDPMRWGRMTIFLEPEANQVNEGYQLWNSLLALGSGGWTGMGLTASRLKASYLPEAHTDFVMAVVGEELGLLGVTLVIVIYVVWTLLALQVARRASSRKGTLLAIALTLGVSIQAVINLGVVSGAFPTKGMPAPFISYGGSNLICSLLATALLLAIAIESDYPDYRKQLRNRFRQLTGWNH